MKYFVIPLFIVIFVITPSAFAQSGYDPAEREWQTSGPFQIDRNEYALGEKIFLKIEGLTSTDKGQVAVMRPLNSTHYSVYLTVPFDGSQKDAFNYYLEPQLSKTRGLCSVDDVLGEWALVFRGTNYPNLNFEITKNIVPGNEESFEENVCLIEKQVQKEDSTTSESLEDLFLKSTRSNIDKKELSPKTNFEYDLYDGFFVSYGRCYVEVEGDNEAFKIKISKIADEIKEPFCNIIDNSRFEYSHITSTEIWFNKIKYGEETSGKFPIVDNEDNFVFILTKNWKQGDSLYPEFGPISELKYLGLGKKEINKKEIDVHEFEGVTYFDDDSRFIGQYKIKSQYDALSGFLTALEFELSAASELLGGGSAKIGLGAVDISEKPESVKESNSEPEKSSEINSDQGGGCLIATATYDSELSPQVQQLRELRDNKLLQTESGSAFMESFNDFYYSFSPIIADYERENPLFKETVKIAITPLISSLSILNHVDMKSDAEVLGFGISLILLNVGMYVGVPIAGVYLVKFRKNP